MQTTLVVHITVATEDEKVVITKTVVVEHDASPQSKQVAFARALMGFAQNGIAEERSAPSGGKGLIYFPPSRIQSIEVEEKTVVLATEGIVQSA